MSQLNSVWVFSDNPERYAELFGGAQQWGQQVYAIVQNTDQAQAVMPYGPKCLYVLAQNDALQRTENYAESIAALLKDKHPAMLLLAAVDSICQCNTPFNYLFRCFELQCLSRSVV